MARWLEAPRFTCFILIQVFHPLSRLETPAQCTHPSGPPVSGTKNIVNREYSFRRKNLEDSWHDVCSSLLPNRKLEKKGRLFFESLS